MIDDPLTIKPAIRPRQALPCLSLGVYTVPQRPQAVADALNLRVNEVFTLAKE